MKSASERVMDYLARRDHSEKELIDKLRRFPYTQEEIDKALDYTKKWIPDPVELAERTSLRLLQKNKGLIYISRYLYSKGLPSVKLDPQLELEKAIDIVSEIKDRDKKIRMLKNRGFTTDTIKRVIYEEF